MKMWKIVSLIVLAALGLVGSGCVVKKMKSKSDGGLHIPTPGRDKYKKTATTQESSKSSGIAEVHSGFDLSKLKTLFNTFSIDISSYDALYHLLNAIEKRAYTETLKAINKEADSPETLIELVEQSPESNFNDVVLENGIGGPFVSVDYVKNLCKDASVDSIGSVDELVKKLLVSATTSGMQHFRVVFGQKIQLLKLKMEHGEDVSVDFREIKDRIARKL